MIFFRLDIKDFDPEDWHTYTASYFIQAIDTLNCEYEVRQALQKAYDEYFLTLGYHSEEEAFDDGICFGSSFCKIPVSITTKYGFYILDIKTYTADWDTGFKKED